MGYYTDFTLTVYPQQLESQVLQEIINLCDGYNPFESSCKWYECHEHVESISLTIPALIIIDGDGEEAGDVWRKAWLNGELVMDWGAKITRPEPSDDLLQKVKEIEKTLTQERIKQLEEELAQLKSQDL